MITFGRFDVPFCDLHLSDSETVLLECESLQTSPVIYMLSVTALLGLGHIMVMEPETSDEKRLKGHYYFVNAILLKVIETDFRIFKKFFYFLFI